MSEIVELLRKGACHPDCDCALEDGDPCLQLKAADVIEELRVELGHWVRQAEDNSGAWQRCALALAAISLVVHTPTSKTKHRTADDHYAADFEKIRQICAGVLT